MLGMLLGALGGGMATAGMLGGISPLLASAIGSGLGSAAETGDLGEGLKAGLGSFLGGKILGGMMNGTSLGTNPAMLPGQQTVNGGLFGGGAGAMTQGTPLFNQPTAMESLLPPPTPAVSPAMSAANNAAVTVAANPGMNIDPSAAAAQAAAQTGPGTQGFFGNMKGVIGDGMKYMQSPEGIGSSIGARVMPALMPGQLFGNKGGDDENASPEDMYPQVTPPPRQQRAMRAGYQPGIDPEWDYGISTPFPTTQLRTMGLGGLTKERENPSRDFGTGNNAGGIDRHMTKTQLDRSMDWYANIMGVDPVDQTSDAYMKFRNTNPAGNDIRAFIGKMSEEANKRVLAENNNGIASLKPPSQGAMPPPGYRPGIDPEYMYGRLPESRIGRNGVPMAAMIEGMAEGGEVQRTSDDKQIIENAVEVIRSGESQTPRAMATITAFVAKFGEQALMQLVDSVQSGEFDKTKERFAKGEKGMVEGPGGRDMVPAKNKSTGEELMVEDGEFVTRADSTAALENEFGDGFMDRMNRAGIRAPEVVKKAAAA